MQITKVGVLGCGLMGSGIAQVAAQAGYEVTVLEAEQKWTPAFQNWATLVKGLARRTNTGFKEAYLESYYHMVLCYAKIGDKPSCAGVSVFTHST